MSKLWLVVFIVVLGLFMIWVYFYISNRSNVIEKPRAMHEIPLPPTTLNNFVAISPFSIVQQSAQAEASASLFLLQSNDLSQFRTYYGNTAANDLLFAFNAVSTHKDMSGFTNTGLPDIALEALQDVRNHLIGTYKIVKIQTMTGLKFSTQAPIDTVQSEFPQYALDRAVAVIKSDTWLNGAWDTAHDEFILLPPPVDARDAGWFNLVPRTAPSFVLFPPLNTDPRVSSYPVQFGSRFIFGNLYQMPQLVHENGERWVIKDTTSTWYIGTVDDVDDPDYGNIRWVRKKLGRAPMEFLTTDTGSLEWAPLFDPQRAIDFLNTNVGRAYHLVDAKSGVSNNMLYLLKSTNKEIALADFVLELKELFNALKDMAESCADLDYDLGNIDPSTWVNTVLSCIRGVFLTGVHYLWFLPPGLRLLASTIKTLVNNSVKDTLKCIAVKIGLDACPQLEPVLEILFTYLYTTETAVAWRLDAGRTVRLSTVNSQVDYVLVTPTSNVGFGASPLLGLEDGNAYVSLYETLDRRYIASRGKELTPLMVETQSYQDAFENGSVFVNYTPIGESFLVRPYIDGSGGELAIDNVGNLQWGTSSGGRALNFRLRPQETTKSILRQAACTLMASPGGDRDCSPFDPDENVIDQFVTQIFSDVHTCMGALAENPTDPTKACSHIKRTLEDECASDLITSGVACAIDSSLQRSCGASGDFQRERVTCLVCDTIGYACTPGEVCTDSSDNQCDFASVTAKTYFGITPLHTTRQGRDYLSVQATFSTKVPAWMQTPTRNSTPVTLSSTKDHPEKLHLFFNDSGVIRSGRFFDHTLVASTSGDKLNCERGNNNTFVVENTELKSAFRLRATNRGTNPPYLASKSLGDNNLYYTKDGMNLDTYWIIDASVGKDTPFIPLDKSKPPGVFSTQVHSRQDYKMTLTNPNEQSNRNNVMIGNTYLETRAKNNFDENYHGAKFTFGTGVYQTLFNLDDLNSSTPMSIYTSSLFAKGSNSSYWRFCNVDTRNFVVGGQVSEGDSNKPRTELVTTGPNQTRATNVVVPYPNNTFAIAAYTMSGTTYKMLTMRQDPENTERFIWIDAGGFTFFPKQKHITSGPSTVFEVANFKLS